MPALLPIRWFACLLLAVFLVPSAHAVDVSVIESVPIQEGGRKKPFLTFANEAVRGLTGRGDIERDGRKLAPLDAVVSMWLAPEGWERVPVVLVNNKPLKEQVGLPTNRKFFSYTELAANKPLLELFAEVTKLRERDSRLRLSGVNKAASEVGMRLAIFEGLVSGRSVTLLPTGAAAWSALGPDDPALNLLRTSYAEGSQEGFQKGIDLLLKEQAAENPRFQANPQTIAIETFYQHLHPFRLAWILYLAAGICLLVFVGRAAPLGYGAAWTFALAGFAVQVVGFVLRILISGRAPVTNMYESVIWVAFGTVFFALVFEAIHRCRYFLLGAVPVAVVSLILADTQPTILDRSIHPLVPVLADNFWLTTHVLTITLSYAAFALALGVGHIVLGKVIFGAKPSPALYNYLYRSIQIGVLLLAVGTVLGAVWANYSWGRFWDWDPKETWALIALLAYLFILHGRIAGKWGGFGMAVGAVIAFQTIIMAWYGVNFVLGVGLHSYGFGTGGFPAALGFVTAELLFVAVAIWRKPRKTAKAARPEPVAA